MNDPFGATKKDDPENIQTTTVGSEQTFFIETKGVDEDPPPAEIQIVVSTSASSDENPGDSAAGDVAANEETEGTEIEQNSSGDTEEIQNASGDSFVIGQLRSFSQEGAEIFESNANDGDLLDEADQEITEIDERRNARANSDQRRGNNSRSRGSLQIGSPITISASRNGTVVQGTIPSDDDQTNSTISTLEANNVSDDLGGRFGDDQLGLSGSAGDDYSCLTGNSSTLDWLNNQVAVAISSGVLSITCKQLRGELHLDKFGSGNRGKCISAYGQWFTPTEFEAFAGRAQCKDWKRSIRFHGRPLLQLIELDILKVHAVSCTCAACWNGDSAGPVRLHDMKRKTSSIQGLITPAPSRRTFSQSSSTQGDPPAGPIDEPLLKQIRLEVQQQNTPTTAGGRSGAATKTVRPLTILQPAEGAAATLGKGTVNLGNATLVRSPGGTLRIANLSTTTTGTSTDSAGHVSIRPTPQASATATVTATSKRQLQLAGNSAAGGQQTLTLLIPPAGGASPSKTQATVAGASRKQTMYLPVSASSGSVTSTATLSSQQGIPLGLTYAPVQLQVPQRQETGGGVTIISADLNEHWSNLEDFANNLQQQVNSLHSMIYLSRQKADKALQDLWVQAQAEKDKEIQKLKSALKQQTGYFSSQNDQPEIRRSNQKLCVNCNRIATMTCAVCQTTFYCSEFCVRRDAAHHREKCLQKGVTVEMVNID